MTSKEWRERSERWVNPPLLAIRDLIADLTEMESLAHEWERSCKMQKGRADAAELLFANSDVALKICEEELKDEESLSDMYAELCRGVAEAIGVPKEGEGSSWHDLPEKVKAKLSPTILADHPKEGERRILRDAINALDVGNFRGFPVLRKEREALEDAASTLRELANKAKEWADKADSALSGAPRKEGE